MARKVFLSILGISCYKRVKYFFEEDKSLFHETNFIQEATLRYFAKNKEVKFDKVYIFLTNKARKTNWETPAQVENERCNRYVGLSEVLTNLNLGTNIKGIDINNGNNETELWKIFQSIYDTIENNDEIYLDVTHSFRSLPIFLTVLLNYAKTLKNISVKSITYGNWEARDENNFAPVIDLITVNELQNWTIAVNEFIKFGYSDDLTDIMKSELNFLSRESENRTDNLIKLKQIAKNLGNFSENIYTVRGKKIVDNKEGKVIYENLSDVQSAILPAFEPLITKLKEKFYTFRLDNDICNGFHVAQWCIDNSLIQQGITILKETITGLICQICKLDYKVEKDRNIVDTAFAIKTKNIEQIESEWNEFALDNKQQILEIIKQDIVNVIYKKFSELSQLRNDINHAGFKNNSYKADMFEKKLKNLLGYFIEKFIICN